MTVTVNGISKQVKVAMPTTAGASVKVIADGIATTVRTDQPNPIGDGDFESGARGWTPLGTGPATAANAAQWAHRTLAQPRLGRDAEHHRPHIRARATCCPAGGV